MQIYNNAITWPRTDWQLTIETLINKRTQTIGKSWPAKHDGQRQTNNNREHTSNNSSYSKSNIVKSIAQWHDIYLFTMVGCLNRSCSSSIDRPVCIDQLEPHGRREKTNENTRKYIKNIKRDDINCFYLFLTVRCFNRSRSLLEKCRRRALWNCRLNTHCILDHR